MRVDRQVEAAAPSGQAMVPDIVIGKRRVVVPDQQPILIREVFNPVAQTGVVQESEVVGAGTQTVVEAQIVAELGEVGVEERLRDNTARTNEPGVRPTGIGFCPISGQAGDRNVVHGEAGPGDTRVGPVPKADRHRLTGIRGQVGGEIHPRARR